jgi:hypothetical protein
MATTATVQWTLVLASSGALFAATRIVRRVWRWWTGPRLSVELLTNLRALGWPQGEGHSLMVLSVANNGKRPTTIRQVTLHQYPSLWDYWLRRATLSAIVNGADFHQPMPYRLEPEQTWSAFIEKDPSIEALAAAGHLYVALTHSAATHSIRRPVIIGSKGG